jgi:hypothetical protein
MMCECVLSQLQDFLCGGEGVDFIVNLGPTGGIMSWADRARSVLVCSFFS